MRPLLAPLLAPLPEYEEVCFLVDRVVCGRGGAREGRLLPTADEGPGLCHVEVLNTEVVNTPSFFVAGAPLSDHYGLATTFRVAV